eukprot:GHVN01085361.1.p2 GENE.GHVN01085361.1~~GHVN01085361.1.p2  ORF type:complete len:106 (-),score=10.86 GHVN01085361.1:396-713(-)
MSDANGTDVDQGEVFIVPVQAVEKVTLCCTHCKKSRLKMLQCSRCKSAQYCDAKCQKTHWAQHKKECKKLETVTWTIHKVADNKTATANITEILQSKMNAYHDRG